MILVTGAGTQLGRALIEFWTEKGQQLRPFDLLDRPWFDRHQSVIGDLLDPAVLRKAVAGAEVVVHLAEARPEGLFIEQHGPVGYDKQMFRTNLEATRLLAQAARDAGVRLFLFASTSYVYGPPPAACPCTEEAPTQPRGPYGRSKLEAEHVLFDMHKAGEIEPVVLRLAPLLGPYFCDNRQLHRICRAAGKNRPVMLVGDPNALRHFVHVRDVVDLLDRCLSRPQAVGRVYNVAGRAAATAGDLARVILDTLGSRSMIVPLPKSIFPVANKLAWRMGEPLVIPELEADAYAHTCFSIERAVSELGWRPKYDTVQALTETAAWYRDHLKNA